MLRAGAALLLGLAVTMPLAAQEAAVPESTPSSCPDNQPCPIPQTGPLSQTQTPLSVDGNLAQELPWQTAWGLVGIRIIPAGVKTAPNGVAYHPNFSIDLNFNCWLWRSERLYLFCDARFWGERPEDGVTNGRDGFLGTSKRKFDFSGGAAWNYAGSWEARVAGYSLSNLNRGTNLVDPTGFNDGCWLENRYYLSSEYARLGETGFDVARATFLTAGYYLSKDLVGNDGKSFKPGPMLGGYLNWDLWDWHAYLFGDSTFIADRSWEPKLLLFDLGLAVRPFRIARQCEFRLGVENTADFQVGTLQSLWYASVRYIF